METLFETFLREKQFLNGVTAKTIESYRDAWTAFKTYGKTDISEQGVKNFMIEMIQKGLTPAGANCYAAAINSFLSWLFDNKHTATRLKVPLQRLEKRVLRTYTPQEMKQILSFKPRYFGEKRVMTILHLMIDTGVRVEEALTLKRSNIDFDSLLITLYGKGKKERKIPISREARKILYNWSKEHRHELIFCSRDGNKVLYDNCRKDFLRVLEKAGVEKSEGCFHAFRRFFAKSYNRNGGNLFYLQKMLGHETLEMTRRYTDVDEEALSEQHRHSSPLENL